MDKIWYRNPSMSEVIGRCGGDEKTMTTKNRQKLNAKKKAYRITILLKSTKSKYYTVNQNNNTRCPLPVKDSWTPTR